MEISIVIPLYNKVRHIKRVLDSVLSQTFHDFEVIVVNDGSTDGSEKIVEYYSDPRIRLIHREHINSWGGHAARNLGIRNAKYDLIAFLDADDEWLPEHLTIIDRMIDKFPHCGAYATALKNWKYNIETIPQGEGIIQNYFQASHRNLPVHTSTVVVLKRVFDEVGYFPEGERNGGDMDMWCRIALEYEVAFSRHVGGVYTKDAEFRVSRNIDPNRTHVCLINTLTNALYNREYFKTTHNDIVEYRNKILILKGALYVRCGDRKVAREILNSVNSTHVFRVLFLKWYILSFIPLFIQDSIRKVFHIGRQIKSILTNKN